ncbi:MAG: hypothetical protein WC054_14065 [Candidatus Nanopelagicales bacterium]
MTAAGEDGTPSTGKQVKAAQRPGLALRSVVDAVGGDQAMRWAVGFAWTLGMLFRFFAADSLFGGIAKSAVVVNYCIVMASSWLIFCIARQVWRRIHSGRVRFWFTLATYLSIALSTSIIQQLLDPRVGDASPVVHVRSLSGVAFLVTFVVILDQYRRQSAATQELLRQRSRLEQARSHYEASLAALRSQLAATVNEFAGSRMRQIVAQLTGMRANPPDPRDLIVEAERIRECAHGVVRELSHTLDSEPVAQREPDLETVVTRESDGQRGRLASFNAAVVEVTRRPFWAGPTALCMGALGTTAATSVRGPLVSAGCGVAIALVTFAGFQLANRAVGSRLPSYAWPIRVLIALVVAALVSLSSTAASTAIFDLRVPILVFMLQFVGIIAVTYALGVNRAIWEDRRTCLQDLSATVDAISWESGRLHDGELTTRREIADVLHGDVQGRLAATALQLEHCAALADQNPGSAASLMPAAIDGSIEAIQESINVLEALAAAPANVTVADVLMEVDAVISAWSAVITVTVYSSSEAIAEVNRSAAARASVVKIIRESIGNAVRHGNATVLSITITLDEGCIEVRALDNGSGVQGTMTAGLGFRSLHRLGANTTLSAAPVGGAELIVHLPLTPAPNRR